ncbi:tetratricopeptide repeat protein [Streptomyces sp. NPDC016566]|uniref:tetratricopeptide repeat protein n=1 Tax=Streptomyces sp. NPDC016566 TaxID=3364967 RepID=UPI0036FBB7AB
MGALKRHRLGGLPSDNALSKVPQLGVSRDTVGAWLRGERFPQRSEALRAVLGEIRAEAARQDVLGAPADGVSGESVAELLAEDRWSQTWEAERLRLTRSNQEGVARQQARRALEDEERRARRAALADRPRPVRSWAPKRLGVHPAIPGESADPDDADFVLPTYVRRAHDVRLHARLAAAVADHASLLVVVRGESCTGKTRTAVEALKAVPDDFQLLFPTDAASLLAMLAADALGRRTVLWLNEAQHYLDSPVGEAVAAALLRRLDAEGPFIALATLWPEHDKTFTAQHTLSRDDFNRQARALLTQAHYVHIPPSFADDLDAVRRAAAQDRSLATALEAGGSDVTQVLAAGPDLVAHYEHPHGPHGVYGKALISAAMDAHRLGITRAIPLAFLHDAAPGYLTDSERAAASPDNWFTGALTYAQKMIKETISPLQNVPRPSGMGALPGVVRLADYLRQHGRCTRRLLCPPTTFWNAATHHLTNPNDLARLADAASNRYRLRHAAHLYRAAAEAGNPYAWVRLAYMRKEAGDQEGADRLIRTAADAGNAYAWVWLAGKREEAGDLEEADRLYRAAAGAGGVHTDALMGLAYKREEAGHRERAEWLYRTAADAGHLLALHRLQKMRKEAGDQEEVERLVRRGAYAGSTYDMVRLAKMRANAGDHQEAERLVRAVVDAGDTDALTVLARSREEAGDHQGAERLYRAAIDAGDTKALRELAYMREEAGDKEEAERLYRAAIDAGDRFAMTDLAVRREEAGDQEEAERLYRAAADAGVTYAWTQLVDMREVGDQEEAERLVRQAVEAGHTYALTEQTDILTESGDEEEAERLYRIVADAGHADALMRLAGRREKAGDEEEAERLYRTAADAGHADALMRLAERREKAGDKEEAERLYRTAADAGHIFAWVRLADIRERAGDQEGAERLYRIVADAGHASSLSRVTEQKYWQYGLEGEHAATRPWPWPEPCTDAGGSP